MNINVKYNCTLWINVCREDVYSSCFCFYFLHVAVDLNAQLIFMKEKYVESMKDLNSPAAKAFEKKLNTMVTLLFLTYLLCYIFVFRKIVIPSNLSNAADNSIVKSPWIFNIRYLIQSS